MVSLSGLPSHNLESWRRSSAPPPIMLRLARPPEAASEFLKAQRMSAVSGRVAFVDGRNIPLPDIGRPGVGMSGRELCIPRVSHV
jgi:hypothetical protein